MTAEPNLPKNVLPLLSDVEGGDPIWLVGGAVRDHLLGRETRDLDFVVQGDALAAARRLADSSDGDYFPLDPSRGTGRALLTQSGGQRLTCDFARMRGPDIEADLRARDFTVNALAIRLQTPYDRFDPLGGTADLRAGRLRACSNSSLQDDPIRSLRAVRLAVQFQFRIEPETLRSIRKVAPNIADVSPERVRDEVVQILGGARPGGALRLLDQLDLLFPIFPELERLDGRSLPEPCEYPALEYAFSVVTRLNQLFSVLEREHDPEAAADSTLAQVAFRLGRHRERVSAYLEQEVGGGRPRRPLLILAALYLPIGPAESAGSQENAPPERTAYRRSSESAGARGRSLRLSNREAEMLETLLLQQRIPSLLGLGASDRAREIHRFYRDMGDAGVGAALLYLARFLGAYTPPVPQNAWSQRLEIARVLLSAYFEAYERIIDPVRLLRGGDLVQAFGLTPSPQIGDILQAIREAQAAGAVRTREQAMNLARRWLEEAQEG
jgi:tRNA nucleotidyltransferase/poly(A) polymerase